MKDILHQIYCLVDESLPFTYMDSQTETALRAALTAEQTALLESYQNQHGVHEDLERQTLFYYALRLGITLALGDTRRP